jgi:hypothetical protein
VTERLLEDRLVALGASMQFPDAESLVADVLAGLDDTETAPGRRRVLIVAAAAVVITVVALAVIPDSRRAIARWLGFDGLRIERVVRLPDTAPAAERTATTMSLAEAAAAVGVEPLVSPMLGEPVAIDAPGRRYVAVHYVDGAADVLVATLPGDLEEVGFTKLVASGARVDEVAVDGARAYWVTGGAHVFMYEAGGEVREARLADDTLVWQRGDVIVRVEGEITLRRALEIATSLDEP